MTNLYPYRSNTTPPIAAEDDSRYETPGGAQQKVNAHISLTSNIADRAVTQPKIADGAVGGRQLDPALLQNYGDIAVQGQFQVVNEQLADYAKQTIQLLDAVDANFPVNMPVLLDYIRSRQTVLMAQFYQMLRNGTPVGVKCPGDSMTYALDNVSSDKRPPINGAPDYMASRSYPEALQIAMNYVYGEFKVIVTNNGFPGDGTKLGYNRHKNMTGGNLAILMYGINDAIGEHIDYKGDIEEYIYWYEQMVVRHILQGRAVVLLGTTKVLDWGVTTIDSFNNAVRDLSVKYGVPFIETDVFMTNFKKDFIFSDEVHFNGTGYSTLGNRIASTLIGRGLLNPNIVGDGDCLLTRKTIDNCVHVNTVWIEGGSFDTPPEVGTASVQALISPGGSVNYSIYTTCDNLLLLPNLYVAADNKTDIILDFGSAQQDFTFDKSMMQEPSVLNAPAYQISFNNLAADVNRESALNSTNYIHISKAGWHTITVKSIEGNTVLNGLEFMSFSSFILASREQVARKTPKLLHVKLYSAWSATPAAIAEKRISITEMNAIFGYNYYQDAEATFNKPVYKLTLYTETQNILQYVFTIGTVGNHVFIPLAPLNIATTPTARTVTDIYDNGNNELVIAFSGETNTLSSFTITLL